MKVLSLIPISPLAKSFHQLAGWFYPFSLQLRRLFIIVFYLLFDFHFKAVIFSNSWNISNIVRISVLFNQWSIRSTFLSSDLFHKHISSYFAKEDFCFSKYFYSRNKEMQPLSIKIFFIFSSLSTLWIVCPKEKGVYWLVMQLKYRILTLRGQFWPKYYNFVISALNLMHL